MHQSLLIYKMKYTQLGMEMKLQNQTQMHRQHIDDRAPASEQPNHAQPLLAP